MDILQRVKSPILEGKEDIQSINEYLFACSQPIEDVVAAFKNGWDEAVLIFADSFDLQDMPTIVKQIEADFKQIESANVEPIEKGKAKKV